jgi:uncharacterized membrane protein
MMGLNMFLAAIPFFISLFLQINQKLKTYQFVVVFLIWLLFFPNSFYFLTDLIHITKLDLYLLNQDTFVYNEDIIEWLKLAHLMLGAIGGAWLGLVSLSHMQQILTKKKIKSINLIMMIILFLSAVGIYIGRFLRFNSWDIINPIHIVKTFFAQFNVFGFLFIIMFFLIMSILYFSFYHFMKEREKSDNL